jgi:hypothetical protein
LLVALVIYPAPVVFAEGSCTGDVNCDGRVGVNELIAGVVGALGNPAAATLRAFDRNGSGTVDIAELVAAVANALDGCRVARTPAATASAATSPPTPTASFHTPTATYSPAPELRGRFARSTSFDAAVADIPMPFGSAGVTSAMSIDLDADGLLDVLVMVGQNGAPRSTWAVHQRAIDVWDVAAEIHILGAPRALSDLNGDGYLDLLLIDPLGVAWGSATGVDLTGVDPLVGANPNPQEASYGSAITPMDLDRDGLTDLAVAAFGGRDRLLFQQPDGSFFEQELDLGLSFAFCPVDFEGDGLVDLIAMVDGLFVEEVNVGGAWRQRSPRVWERSHPPGWPADAYLAPGPLEKGTPMGCAWGDLDGDRDLELFLTQTSEGTPIYDRHGDSWRDIGRDVDGIAGYPINDLHGWEFFWGVAIVDFDGDGRDDIAVAGGSAVREYEGVSHLAFFVQRPGGFDERGGELGLDETGDFQSLIADDLDRDGRPDLLVGSFAGLPRLYLNRIEARGGTVVLELAGRTVEYVEIEIVGERRSWKMRPGLQAQPLTGARPVLFRGVGDEAMLELRVHWRGGTQVTQVLPRPEPWVLIEP